MKDKDGLILEDIYQKIGLGVSPNIDPTKDPNKPTRNNGKDYPRAETPLGIGYVIDRDPRGYIRVWFSRWIQETFHEDEIEYL